MRTLTTLIEALESAAERTYQAQVRYIEKCGQELAAKQILEDYEDEVRAEGADKSKHPELTNDNARRGFFVAMMGSGLGQAYREAWGKAWEDKMAALAEYDRLRRRGADLRTMVNALSAGRE